MKKVQVISEFIEYASAAELPAQEKELLAKAEEAAKNAYAPYSKFKVGAAVLLENGKIIIGSNQENASYPLGLCAERVALFAASAQHPGIKITGIAVTSSSENPASPCGACRQVMAEYEMVHQNEMRILLKGASEKIIATDGVKNLLPLMFSGKDFGG
jgi:cytidine deaminase